MGELIAAGLVSLIVAGSAVGVYFGFRARAKKTRRQEAVFRDVAARHGGTFIDSTGLLPAYEREGGRGWVSRVGAAVELELDQVYVRIDNIAGETNDGAWTRFRAAAVMPWAPALRVRKRGRLGKLIAGTDEGDGSDFEQLYSVKSKTPDVARAVVTERARELLMAKFPDSALVADGRLVWIYAQRFVVDLETLEAGAELVADVARQPAALLDVLRSLPDMTFVPPRGEIDERTTPAATLELRGAPVRILPVATPDGLAVAATTACQRELPDYVAHVDAAGVPGTVEAARAIPAGAITPHAAESLAALGECEIECTAGELRVLLPWPVDARRLPRAAEAAAVLAADPSLSTFR